ncbi:class I SAM-dependent methyltransferase [soil metagenome]
MSDPELAAGNERTRHLLEEAYLAAPDGPGGSGVSGYWERKRRPLASAFDGDGSWLDVGCANGHLLETLPGWVLADRGHHIEPSGLELLGRIAERARERLPHVAERIHPGEVMTWAHPQWYRFVTVLDDAVPPLRLEDMVRRVLDDLVEPGGRLVSSDYRRRDEPSVDRCRRLRGLGLAVAGSNEDRPPDGSTGRRVTVWVDARPPVG